MLTSECVQKFQNQKVNILFKVQWLFLYLKWVFVLQLIMADSNKKLKILCLHGYRQNSFSFKQKMNGFRKCIKNIAELVFIEAPHAISGDSNSDCDQEIGQTFSWWFCDETNNFSSLTECEVAKGFKESIDLISQTFKTLGPFDGILGFSQGAAIVALICCLKECHEFAYDFKFVILISGFKSLAKCHQYLYKNPATTKSLFVYGLNDTCISKERSGLFSEVFLMPTIVVHDGGHYVPCHSDVKKQYVAFLKSCF
ncbi:hypothetical protein JTE90_021534 [Oedothorax gibbosus]|uniref:Serine hydrolase domain-containing protein n=1 Tax=Oedothorax gibbosus TaxID=931172 RepID=A0AAV6VP64_9ARAC|nr:hypothetical protein JTE90_021534 [Oedothorax gibbosus]